MLPRPIVEVLERAAAHFFVTVPEMLGRERNRSVVLARQCAMFVLRGEPFRRSYAELGRVFNQTDHTSAMNACRKVERLLAKGDECATCAVAAIRAPAEVAA